MKTNLIAREDSLKAYEQKQAEIAKLLKQIAAGLEKHDRDAIGGHNWAYVGDLTAIAETLTDIKDHLYGTGEYAK